MMPLQRKRSPTPTLQPMMTDSPPCTCMENCMENLDIQNCMENSLSRKRKLLYESSPASLNDEDAAYNLIDAVRDGDIEVVEKLLDKGANVTAKGYDGNTPLHCAVVSNNSKVEVISSLLRHGADVNAVDKKYVRPLHVAVALGHLHIVEILLKYGADINCVCSISKRYTSSYNSQDRRRSTNDVRFLLSRGTNDLNGEDSITPLHIAAKEGHSNIAEYLLNHGASINPLTSNEGYTPLHLATKNGHRTCVELLLRRGVMVDIRGNNGKTILQLAVENGCPTIVENILTYCPDINNQSNISSLKTAVHRSGEEHKKIVDALLEYGFTVSPKDAMCPNFLHTAVKNGHLKIVEERLKYGVAVNVLNSTLGTLLISAVKNKQEEVAKLLISYKADINAKDKDWNSPMFYAIKNKDFNMAKLLLTNGAIVKDDPGLLNSAVDSECIDIVEVLLEHGVPYGNESTALHRTAYPCNGTSSITRPDFTMGKIAKLLLSKGANVEAELFNYDDKIYLETTLQIACKNGVANVVEALLEYNVNVNVGAESDSFPLHTSSCHGHEEICTMLLNKGANVNATDSNGSTALHGAAESGSQKTVETLLTYGADVNSIDKHGNTALHRASKCRRMNIITTLLQHGSDINIENSENQTPVDVARAKYLSMEDGLIERDEDDSDDDDDFCWYRDIVEALERHIVKLKAANLYVRDKYNTMPIKYDDFQKVCKREIGNMKSEIINNTYVSFYDVLVKDTNSVGMYLRNEFIVQVMESGDYKTKFPTYADMIETQFRKGMERKKLLQQSNMDNFHVLFHNFPELPQDYIEIIVNYLSVKDLRALVDASARLS